jgi:hypothetical protein
LSELETEVLKFLSSHGGGCSYSINIFVASGVETESGSVDNSDLHVLEDVKVVAEFAGAWPWLGSNAPRPLLQTPVVKYIVEDSIHSDSRAPVPLAPSHARARQGQGSRCACPLEGQDRRVRQLRLSPPAAQCEHPISGKVLLGASSPHRPTSYANFPTDRQILSPRTKKTDFLIFCTIFDVLSFKKFVHGSLVKIYTNFVQKSQNVTFFVVWRQNLSVCRIVCVTRVSAHVHTCGGRRPNVSPGLPAFFISGPGCPPQ